MILRRKEREPPSVTIHRYIDRLFTVCNVNMFLKKKHVNELIVCFWCLLIKNREVPVLITPDKPKYPKTHLRLQFMW